MKFQSISAFQKHLNSSAPNHFPPIYACVLKDPYERRYLLDKTYEFLRHYYPNLEVERIENVEDLSEGSLFYKERVIVLDEVEKYKGEELKGLIRRFSTLDPRDRVLLGGESIPKDLYEALEENLVCLDLSAEKPWERKRRLLEEGIYIASKRGKKIALPVLEEIFLRVGEDLGALKNEIEKLSLYRPDKGEIVLEDVHLLTKERIGENSWRIAEGVVLGEGVEDPNIRDLSELFALFGQIRFFLYIGLTMAEQFEKGEALSHPNVKKGQMEKWAPFVARVGSTYFKKALCSLFEKEVEAKTFFVNPSVLWDRVVLSFFHDAALTS